MTPNLLSIRNLLGSSVTIPNVGTIILDDCLLDHRDWSLARIIGHSDDWGLDHRHVSLDPGHHSLACFLGACRQSEANHVADGRQVSPAGSAPPRSPKARPSGTPPEPPPAKARPQSRTAREPSPEPALLPCDCPPAPDSPMRSARSLLLGQLLTEEGPVGPIIDLLLDLDSRRLQLLQVSDSARGSGRHILMDIRETLDLEYHGDSGAISLTCRRISELLAED